MRTFRDLDELEAARGTDLGTSSWRTVEQHEVDQFAEATGDRQWIHIDVDRAADGPFGTTIAHGYLTLALVPGLVGEIYAVDSVEMLINYGTDRVRFPAPLPVESTVRANAFLTDLRRDGQTAMAHVRVTIERDGASKPVCVADTLVLLREG